MGKLIVVAALVSGAVAYSEQTKPAPPRATPAPTLTRAAKSPRTPAPPLQQPARGRTPGK